MGICAHPSRGRRFLGREGAGDCLGGALYEAAAFDWGRQRVFLAGRGAPSPRDRSDLGCGNVGPAPPVELGAAVGADHASRVRRHAAPGSRPTGANTVLAIEIDAVPPRVQVVASGLNWPSALVFDRERHRLSRRHLGRRRALEARVRELSAALRYGSHPPRLLRRPRTLAVDPGEVWSGPVTSKNEVTTFGFSARQAS